MSITLFAYDPTLTVAGLGGTFTRADASTCATYVDANGVVQTVAANVLRNSHYVSGVRTTLLEGSRQNICLRSDALNNATWSKFGTPTVTDNFVQSGALNLSRIQGTPGTDGVSQAITFTGDGVKSFLVFAKANGVNGTHNWQLRDNTAPAVRGEVILTVSGTVVSGSASTGTLLQTVALGGGIYCFLMQTTSVTAANAHTMKCGPDAGTCTDIVTGAVQVENAAFPSSYIPTGAAAVTRAADALSFPFLPVPQAMTVYFKAVDVGESVIGAATRTGEMVTIGTTSAESFYFSTPNGKYSVNQVAAAGSGASTQTAAANASGDTVEVLGSLSAAGTPQLTYSFNGAAEVSPAAGTTRALDATFAAPTIWVGGRTAATTPFLAFQKIVVASGVQSLATMRTLTATSGVVSATLAPSSVVAEGAWYAQPAYTVLDTGTATALQASAIPTNTNQQVRVLRLDVTCSAAPAAGTIVNIQDGGTVLWQGVLSAGSRKLTVDFTRKPLRGSRGATVTAEMASAGGSVVQTIVMTCDTVRAP